MGRLRVGSGRIMSSEILKNLQKGHTPSARAARKETLIKKYNTTNTFSLPRARENLLQYYENYYLTQNSVSFQELPIAAQRRRVLNEQTNSCLWCGISDWNNKTISLELDHIDGNIKNNDRNNLRFLCPNCHSQTPTWRRKKCSNSSPIKDTELLLAYDNCGNIYRALQSVGLTPRGGNYMRLKSLLNKREIEKF